MRRRGVVYYLRHGEDGPIKIGFTTKSVFLRVQQLQAASPEVLSCVGVEDGEITLERFRLHQFRKQQKRGEWFEPGGPLQIFLDDQFPGYSQEDLEQDYYHKDLAERVRRVRGRTKKSRERFGRCEDRHGLQMNVPLWFCKETIPNPFPTEKLVAICEELEATQDAAA